MSPIEGSQARETVAVIGLGRMGLPMASRLAAAGYQVRGHDLAASARQALAEADGAVALDDAGEAVAGAAVTILLLPNSKIVEAVLDGGVLEALAAGTLLVDMGSSDPLSSREIARRAAGRGVRFVDAPVSGGVRGAVGGSLTIIVGGDDEDVERCRPLLEQLGTTISHVGPAGAGHALKAINNLLSATTLLASSEALELGRRFGLDSELMLAVINASSGRSFSTERKLPDYVLPESFDSGFSVGLMTKDMRTALSLAERIGVTLRLGAASTALWEAALDDLSGDADHTEIARWAAAERPESA